MREKQMFLWLLVPVLVVVDVQSHMRFEHPEEWQLWKMEHRKSYESQRQELERHLVWLSNREYINAHNKKSVVTGFSLKLNHFADWTDEEFQKVYLTYRPGNNGEREEHKMFESLDDLPLVLDWRTRGAVSQVKEQGQCGSSYAFSAVGAVEGAWALRHGKLVNISAQNIIDCSGDYGNDGCNGGNMKNSFRYMTSNKGINSAYHYPYKARKSSCEYNSSLSVARITGSKSVSAGNETQLMQALAKFGPISVAVDASSRTFRFYYRGVYRSQRCSSSSLTHAMLLIGYGTTNQRDYWLVKNSWGVYWGIDGYILMARNLSNECGIASDASFPILS